MLTDSLVKRYFPEATALSSNFQTTNGDGRVGPEVLGCPKLEAIDIND
jgi:hypothetical protein